MHNNVVQSAALCSVFLTRPVSSNPAQALSARGVELLSTGGTARLLTDKGLPVAEVSDYTSFRK